MSGTARSRRRVERDLHEGPQQQLVAITTKRRACSSPPGECGDISSKGADALEGRSLGSVTGTVPVR